MEHVRQEGRPLERVGQAAVEHQLHHGHLLLSEWPHHRRWHLRRQMHPLPDRGEFTTKASCSTRLDSETLRLCVRFQHLKYYSLINIRSNRRRYAKGSKITGIEVLNNDENKVSRDQTYSFRLATDLTSIQTSQRSSSLRTTRESGCTTCAICRWSASTRASPTRPST